MSYIPGSVPDPQLLPQGHTVAEPSNRLSMEGSQQSGASYLPANQQVPLHSGPHQPRGISQFHSQPHPHQHQHQHQHQNQHQHAPQQQQQQQQSYNSHMSMQRSSWTVPGPGNGSANPRNSSSSSMDFLTSRSPSQSRHRQSLGSLSVASMELTPRHQRHSYTSSSVDLSNGVGYAMTPDSPTRHGPSEDFNWSSSSPIASTPFSSTGSAYATTTPGWPAVQSSPSTHLRPQRAKQPQPNPYAPASSNGNGLTVNPPPPFAQHERLAQQYGMGMTKAPSAPSSALPSPTSHSMGAFSVNHHMQQQPQQTQNRLSHGNFLMPPTGHQHQQQAQQAQQAQQYQYQSGQQSPHFTSKQGHLRSHSHGPLPEHHGWVGLTPGVEPPSIKAVRSKSELYPATVNNPKFRRALPDGGFVSPLVGLTVYLSSTYSICDPKFTYSLTRNPRRVLTEPHEGKLNNGFDNEESDYILWVNDVLGVEGNRRYLVLNVLGKGTFGQVVKCQNMVTKEVVAVKVIKNKPAYLNQSMMEVSILEHIQTNVDKDDQHNLLRLKDKFMHKEHLCLVFELLSSNLYEVIKKNQFRGLNVKLVKMFSQQLLDSLAVLKDARLVHCDLKPENILLKRNDTTEIKIIDFGSACHERQSVYTYIQSRFYRSPEVLLGLPYTSSIDMWSLGCIIAELFLGLPIFPGSSEYNQWFRIVQSLGEPPNWMLEMGKNTSNFMKKYVDQYGEKRYRLRTIEEQMAEFGTQEKPMKQYFSSTDIREIIMQYPLLRNDMTEIEVREEMEQREALADFVKGLLNFNPFERWTPQQASLHPFVTGRRFEGPFVPMYESAQSHSQSHVLQEFPNMHLTNGAMGQDTGSAMGHEVPQAFEHHDHGHGDNRQGLSVQVQAQGQAQAQAQAQAHLQPGRSMPPQYYSQHSQHSQQARQKQPQPNHPGMMFSNGDTHRHNLAMPDAGGNVYSMHGQSQGQGQAAVQNRKPQSRRMRAATIGQPDPVPRQIQRAAAMVNPANVIQAQPSPAYIPPPELYRRRN